MQTTTIDRAPRPARQPLAGGYIWQEELEAIADGGQEIAQEFRELVDHAPTTQAARRYGKLASEALQISVKALKLKNFRVKYEQPATAA